MVYYYIIISIKYVQLVLEGIPEFLYLVAKILFVSLLFSIKYFGKIVVYSSKQ